MRKSVLIIAALTLAMPIMAQETQEPRVSPQVDSSPKNIIHELLALSHQTNDLQVAWNESFVMKYRRNQRDGQLYPVGTVADQQFARRELLERYVRVRSFINFVRPYGLTEAKYNPLETEANNTQFNLADSKALDLDITVKDKFTPMTTYLADLAHRVGTINK